MSTRVGWWILISRVNSWISAATIWIGIVIDHRWRHVRGLWLSIVITRLIIIGIVIPRLLWGRHLTTGIVVGIWLRLYIWHWLDDRRCHDDRCGSSHNQLCACIVVVLIVMVMTTASTFVR